MEVRYKKPCHNSLLITLKELYDGKTFTDCKLDVQDTIFCVHKPILYCNSPMLKTLLIAETQDKYKDVIKLEGMIVQYFKPVLEYMYTEVITINPDNIVGVLSTVDYLQMLDLKQLCLSTLLTYLTPQNCIEYYQVASLYNDDDLRKASCKKIFQHMSEIQVDFNQCSVESVKSILSDEYTKSEWLNNKEMFFALKQWIESEVDARDVHFSQLASLFDFTKFSASCLKSIVSDPVMKRHPDDREKVIEILTEEFEKREQEHSLKTQFKSQVESNKNIRGQLRCKFSNISKLVRDKDVLSCGLVCVQGLPWELSIKKIQRDNCDWLSVYAICNRQSDSAWKCSAFVRFTLVSNGGSNDHVIRPRGIKFENGSGSKGYATFKEWDEVISVSPKGYLSNSDEILIQLDIEINTEATIT